MGDSTKIAKIKAFEVFRNETVAFPEQEMKSCIEVSLTQQKLENFLKKFCAQFKIGSHRFVEVFSSQKSISPRPLPPLIRFIGVSQSVKSPAEDDSINFNIESLARTVKLISKLKSSPPGFTLNKVPSSLLPKNCELVNSLKPMLTQKDLNIFIFDFEERRTLSTEEYEEYVGILEFAKDLSLLGSIIRRPKEAANNPANEKSVSSKINWSQLGDAYIDRKKIAPLENKIDAHFELEEQALQENNTIKHSELVARRMSIARMIRNADELKKNEKTHLNNRFMLKKNTIDMRKINLLDSRIMQEFKTADYSLMKSNLDIRDRSLPISPSGDRLPVLSSATPSREATYSKHGGFKVRKKRSSNLSRLITSLFNTRQSSSLKKPKVTISMNSGKLPRIKSGQFYLG